MSAPLGALAPFVNDGDGVLVTLPAGLVQMFAALAQQSAGDHPLATHAGRPLAVVPDSDADPLSALEAEFASDGLRAAHAELVAAQGDVIATLAAAPAHAGIVRVRLDAAQSGQLLAWLNRMYVSARTTDLGLLAVGDEQSPLGMLGITDEEPDTIEVPFGQHAVVFVLLTDELLNALP